METIKVISNRSQHVHFLILIGLILEYFHAYCCETVLSHDVTIRDGLMTSQKEMMHFVHAQILVISMLKNIQQHQLIIIRKSCKDKGLEMLCFIRLNRCVLLQSLRRIDWKERGLSFPQAVAFTQSKEHTLQSLDISFAQAFLLAQKYGAHSLDSVQDILGWCLTCAIWLLATMLGMS